MGSTEHFDNRKKKILILGIGAMQGFDNTTLTVEKPYAINFGD